MNQLPLDLGLVIAGEDEEGKQVVYLDEVKDAIAEHFDHVLKDSINAALKLSAEEIFSLYSTTKTPSQFRQEVHNVIKRYELKPNSIH